MKKVVSILLALTILLSGVPIGFTAEKTPGQTLFDLGLVKGYGNGDLAEGNNLTRAEMMVLIAQLKGESQQAQFYALPPKFVDVDPYAWYAPYVAYAAQQGWSAGLGGNKFGPNQMLTAKETAAFMIKVLGYTVYDFNKSVEQAIDLGIIKNSVVGTKSVTRGEVFDFMLNTLKTPVKGSSVTLGAQLGVMLPDKPVQVADYAIENVNVLSYNLVEVKLKEAATVADASKFLVKDTSGRALTIQKADLIDNKTIWLTTTDQTAGIVYSVLANGDYKFTGMAKDSQKPAIVKTASSAMDNMTVKVTFDKDMDRRTVLNASNYTATNNMTVLGAKFALDNNGKEIYSQVLLTTSSMQSGQIYRITASKMVTDLAGNQVKDFDELNQVAFGGLSADTTAPVLTTAYALNGMKLKLVFDDASDLNQATAENIGNYQIINKTDVNKPVSVVEAKLIKNADGKYKEVELRTTLQELSHSYEVSVNNVSDKFGNVISKTTGYKSVFIGQAADKTGPQVFTVESLTNTQWKIKFNEPVNKTTAEVAGNYTVNKDLVVVKATQDPDDKTVVYLTTSSQKSTEVYTVKISNVLDEYGNAVSSNTNAYLIGKGIDSSRPTLSSAEALVENGKSYVKVTFSKAVDSKAALIGSNYYFGSKLGYGLQVEKLDGYSFKVRVNPMQEGTAYRLVVSNVEDLSGNMIDSSTAVANFVGRAVASNEAPEVVGVATIDSYTIKVLFSRPMIASATESRVVAGSVNEDAANPANYKVYPQGNNTPVNLGTVYAYVDKDRMGVVLRFSNKALDEGKLYEIKVNANGDSDNFDNQATSLYADNNLPLDTSKATKLFGGINKGVTKPQITAVYPINKEVVDIKFNTTVKKAAGFTTGSITIAGSNGSSYGVVASYSDTLSSDPTVFRVKVNGTLAYSTNYTLTISDRTKIVDAFETETVDGSSNNYYSGSFYGPINDNEAPLVANVVTYDASSLLVTFNEEVRLISPALISVTTNAGDSIATNVEYGDSTQTSLRVYFNNTNMTAGNIYKLKISANAITDTVGKQNTSITEDFAVIGGTRTKATISDAVVIDNNTIRVLFSRPIADTSSNLNAADFTITGAPGGTTWKVVNAYDNGAAVSVPTNGNLGTNTYVDIIDIRSDKVLEKETSYSITFTNTSGTFTQGNYATKDGAGLDGVPSKSFSGRLILSNVALSSGFDVVDSATDNQATVTINDSYLNLSDIKTRYTKVGVISSASSNNTFNTTAGILNAINGYNTASSTAKAGSITTLTATGLTGSGGAGTANDFLIVFHDYKNNFLGYALKKNVSIVNASSASSDVSGLTWAKGATVETAKATAAGTLKVKVAAAGEARPNVGATLSGYTDYTSGNDIAITNAAHKIYIAKVDGSGNVLEWSEIAISKSIVRLAVISGSNVITSNVASLIPTWNELKADLTLAGGTTAYAVTNKSAVVANPVTGDLLVSTNGGTSYLMTITVDFAGAAGPTYVATSASGTASITHNASVNYSTAVTGFDGVAGWSSSGIYTELTGTDPSDIAATSKVLIETTASNAVQVYTIIN